MLKLMKYEIIQSWRGFIAIFVGYLILAILCGLNFDIGYGVVTSDTEELISGILLTAFTFTAIGIMIGSFIVISKNYSNSMYGKGAALTHTLPVNTHQIILAKLVSSFLWIVISTLVLIFGFITLILLVEGNFSKYFFDVVSDLFGILPTAGYFYYVMSAFNFITLVFLSISLANSSFIRSHRTFWSIFFFFFISILVGNINESINSMDFNYFYPLNIYESIEHVTNVLWFGGSIQAGLAIAYYFLTYFIIDKKMEVQ